MNLVVSTLQGGGVADIASTPRRHRVGISSRRAVAALTANGVGTCGADDNQAQAGHIVTHALTAEGADASEDGTGRGTPLVAFHLTQDPISGSISPAMGTGNSEGCATIGVAIPLAVRGRDGGSQIEAGEDGEPYNALRAGNGGSSRQSLVGTGSAEVTAVRRLTPMECERLQGFPDGWTEGQADSARYRQMGNAVAVPVVEWIMRRLVAVERGRDA